MDPLREVSAVAGTTVVLTAMLIICTSECIQQRYQSTDAALTPSSDLMFESLTLISKDDNITSNALRCSETLSDLEPSSDPSRSEYDFVGFKNNNEIKTSITLSNIGGRRLINRNSVNYTMDMRAT
jgi:hypothetical protein